MCTPNIKMTSSNAMSSSGVTVQEYSVRVPKVTNKQNRVMQFNSSLLVDFTKWTQVKMVREVPARPDQPADEPKFGAGSEFGKDMREEARRKKLGIVAKKRSPDSFPWLMKVGGKAGKKYRGVRNGSVTENASYYVFTQAKDGAFEAYPISEWYMFQPIQRYKALSAEEAEERFAQRHKIMNHFMVKSRLKTDEDADGEDEEKHENRAAAKPKKSGDFRLTDMDDWPDSSDEGGEAEDADGEERDERQRKRKETTKAKEQRRKRKKGLKDEAFEDSDDGDGEGRELDYISDSSDSEEELKPQHQERGVDQEDALKRLLDSDAELEHSSSEEEKKEEKNEEEKQTEEGAAPEKRKKSKKKKKKKREEGAKEGEGKSSDSEPAADSSEDEVIADANAKKALSASGSGADAPPPAGAQPAPAAALSTPPPPPPPAATATAATAAAAAAAANPGKRKVDQAVAAAAASNAKRARTEAATAPPAPPQVVSDTGITEEAVRRYLTRKPMTTTELLQKFKSKKVGLSSDQLVPVIAQILKKINPSKQTIKGKMYLSIKK